MYVIERVGVPPPRSCSAACSRCHATTEGALAALARAACARSASPTFSLRSNGGGEVNRLRLRVPACLRGAPGGARRRERLERARRDGARSRAPAGGGLGETGPRERRHVPRWNAVANRPAAALDPAKEHDRPRASAERLNPSRRGARWSSGRKMDAPPGWCIAPSCPEGSPRAHRMLTAHSRETRSAASVGTDRVLARDCSVHPS